MSLPLRSLNLNPLFSHTTDTIPPFATYLPSSQRYSPICRLLLIALQNKFGLSFLGKTHPSTVFVSFLFSSFLFFRNPKIRFFHSFWAMPPKSKAEVQKQRAKVGSLLSLAEVEIEKERERECVCVCMCGKLILWGACS